MNFKFRLPKIKKVSKRIRKVTKKTNVQKKRKKTSLKRIKKSYLPAQQRLTKEEKEGMALGKLATGVWKLQENPGKVYVTGKRIHHGLVGAILTFVGAVSNDDSMKGFGKALMKDDSDDVHNWLNFEDVQNSTSDYA